MAYGIGAEGRGANGKIVVLDSNGVRTIPLGQYRQWTISRKGSAASQPGGAVIEVASPIVSAQHGWVFCDERGHWYYSDNPDNTNGTIYKGSILPRPSRSDKPVCVRLMDGDILRIDNANSKRTRTDAVLLLYTETVGSSSWKRYPLTGKTSVTIGRSSKCDIRVPVPYVSGRHAVLTNTSSGWTVSDCDSKAGTYLNNHRVTRSALVREKDCIAVADCKFFLVGQSVFYCGREETMHSVMLTSPSERPVILHAKIRRKRVKDFSGTGTKELIRDVNIDIRGGTLVAMLGTAGAGKSTVMNCLNGMDLAGVEGSVFYRNVDLMKDFDRMKQMIGNVPQQKVFHKTFTPEQEFRLAARKRLPGDTTDAEIEERVNAALHMLSMEGVRKNRNSKLSGGEQTRVNVGIELVADRDLLCLDEPDQGLSPNYKHELFEILRNLAHKNGKTILAIIHDVSEIDMFDQVIILAKKDGVGRLAFSGSPKEARAHFGADIRDVYALLEREPERYIR